MRGLFMILKKKVGGYMQVFHNSLLFTGSPLLFKSLRKRHYNKQPIYLKIFLMGIHYVDTFLTAVPRILNFLFK